MNRKNRAVLLLLAVLGLWSFYQYGENRDKVVVLPTESAPKPDYLAPEFMLKALDGADYKVGGKREKPLVVNFWASWCGPCEEEAPDLTRLYDKYKDKLDLYAVNVTGNDELTAAKGFAERFKFSFPVLLDEKLEASKLYRLQVIPTSYLIDKNGVIVDVINLLDAKELEKKFKKLTDS